MIDTNNQTTAQVNEQDRPKAEKLPIRYLKGYKNPVGHLNKFRNEWCLCEENQKRIKPYRHHLNQLNKFSREIGLAFKATEDLNFPNRPKKFKNCCLKQTQENYKIGMEHIPTKMDNKYFPWRK